MTDQIEVYRKLQKHLNKMPVGYPATKTGIEINLLKSIFTPEQAAIVPYLDYKIKSLDQIFETAREVVNSKGELKQILDAAVSNGGIFRAKRDGKEYYRTLPFVSWGMYEHQLNRMEQSFLDGSNEYLQGELALELATGRLPVMRVIPVEESIDIEHHIASYDELRNLIEISGEHIAVQDCLCKKAGDLKDEPCQSTDRRDVCMSFGDLADLYIEEGWARRLDQEQALEIARLNEKEGLVLMPDNALEPKFMCSCCSDCCLVLNLIKNYPNPADAVASNYFAAVDLARCTGVGDCVGCCPLDAITLVEDQAEINVARCIGCGLCVPICPEDAISMQMKEEETIPPKTMEERFDYELAQKSSLSGRIRNFSLKTFLRLVFRLAPTPEKN
jgi:ferredoxin